MTNNNCGTCKHLAGLLYEESTIGFCSNPKSSLHKCEMGTWSSPPDFENCHEPITEKDDDTQM